VRNGPETESSGGRREGGRATEHVVLGADLGMRRAGRGRGHLRANEIGDGVQMCGDLDDDGPAKNGNEQDEGRGQHMHNAP
jgi:hypothetical protein